MFRVRAVSAAIVLALFLAPGHAQGGTAPVTPAESRWHGGVGLFGAASRGKLKDIFGTGFGIEATGIFRLDHSGVLGLRIQGGMIDYGSETNAVPLTGAGPSFGVKIATKRNATSIGVGPHLGWPHGRLRPYVYAMASAAYFTSRADLSGRDSLGRYIVLSGDLNRVGFGGSAGGGVTFRITERMSLDAGSEFRRYTDVRTLGNGATELSNGAVFITENRGDLSMILYRLGVTVKLAAGRGHRRLPRSPIRPVGG